MDDRRKLKRRHIMFYSRVFDRKTGKLLGYLGNITTGGVMIISEEPIQKELVFKLRIDLPDYLYNRSVLNFRARSVWCEPDIDPSFFNTGFELIGIPPENQSMIEKILSDFGLQDP